MTARRAIEASEESIGKGLWYDDGKIRANSHDTLEGETRTVKKMFRSSPCRLVPDDMAGNFLEVDTFRKLHDFSLEAANSACYLPMTIWSASENPLNHWRDMSLMAVWCPVQFFKLSLFLLSTSIC
jgi:hypothetical protein